MSTSPTLKPSDVTSTWLQRDVAEAQLALVVKQLMRPSQTIEFVEFKKAMDIVASDMPKGGSFLDVGCGVAHYGVYLALNYPQFSYHGTDVSPEMIALSLRPAEVEVRAYWQNDWLEYNVILLSQVIEVQENPKYSMEVALTHSKVGAYLIFHRLRLSPQPTYRVEEDTYSGRRTSNVYWNEKETLKRFWEIGTVLHISRWGQYTTVVLYKDG